jgi:crotonobetainyl-CoA:carnitine CoA-transferase CaiB-like acyl-CoA transferase
MATPESIVANAPDMAKILAGEFSKRTFAEWVELLARFGGQWAPVQDALSVKDDHQAVVNGYVSEMTSSTGVELTDVQPPVQYNGTPSSHRPAPLFNENASEILKEIGLDAGRVLELQIANAIA